MRYISTTFDNYGIFALSVKDLQKVKIYAIFNENFYEKNPAISILQTFCNSDAALQTPFDCLNNLFINSFIIC